MDSEAKLEHQWILEEDGERDDFQMDVGYHNGPRCSVCGFSYCHHCGTSPENLVCPGKEPNS